jgi:hypothetical protein
MSKEKVQIVKSFLAKQVNDGMKKDQLAEYYGLNISEMGRVLKQAGLKIRKFHTPNFELVEEEELDDVILGETSVIETEVVESENVTEEIAETAVPQEMPIWEN